LLGSYVSLPLACEIFANWNIQNTILKIALKGKLLFEIYHEYMSQSILITAMAFCNWCQFESKHMAWKASGMTLSTIKKPINSEEFYIFPKFE
jgi:hypothetical protein